MIRVPSSILIFVSRKVTEEAEISEVNLKKSVLEFKCVMNRSSAS